jgi:hypothetical protein
VWCSVSSDWHNLLFWRERIFQKKNVCVELCFNEVRRFRWLKNSLLNGWEKSESRNLVLFWRKEECWFYYIFRSHLTEKMRTSNLNRNIVIMPGGSGIDKANTDCGMESEAKIQSIRACCGFFRTGFCLSDTILDACYKIWAWLQ